MTASPDLATQKTTKDASNGSCRRGAILGYVAGGTGTGAKDGDGVARQADGGQGWQRGNGWQGGNCRQSGQTAAAQQVEARVEKVERRQFDWRQSRQSECRQSEAGRVFDASSSHLLVAVYAAVEAAAVHHECAPCTMLLASVTWQKLYQNLAFAV